MAKIRCRALSFTQVVPSTKAAGLVNILINGRTGIRTFLCLVVVLAGATWAQGQSPASTIQHPNTQRILVKLRPAFAQEIEAGFPAQGPLTEMTVQATVAGAPELRRFMARHHASQLAPLYPDMIRARQQYGWSDGEIAARLRQQFNLRASRQPFSLPTPEISRTYVLEVPPATALQVDMWVRELKADPGVEFAEPEHIFTAIQLPNDPYLQSSGSWGQAYQDLWGLYKISAPTAWNTVQGDGIVVAVVDTGVDYKHPDIAGNVMLVQGADFADNANDPIDHFGHGTHVAGTIAAVGNNGIGVIGVAWHAKVIPVKGLGDTGSGTDSMLAQAITFAANSGADIINASWGGQGSSQTIEDAIQFAYGLGVVFVAAAGNSSEDALNFFPANSPEAITVAASDPNDQLASFSDFGSKIDVAAPGVDVLSLQANGTQLGPPPTPGTTGYVGMRVHHINPLFGHPGGIPTLFPTGGLPAYIHSNPLNLKVLDPVEHLAVHRAIREAETAGKVMVNPATTAARTGMDIGRSCGCH